MANQSTLKDLLKHHQYLNAWLNQRHQIYQHQKNPPHDPDRSHTVKDAAGHLHQEPGNTWAEGTT